MQVIKIIKENSSQCHDKYQNKVKSLTLHSAPMECCCFVQGDRNVYFNCWCYQEARKNHWIFDAFQSWKMTFFVDFIHENWNKIQWKTIYFVLHARFILPWIVNRMRKFIECWAKQIPKTINIQRKGKNYCLLLIYCVNLHRMTFVGSSEHNWIENVRFDFFFSSAQDQWEEENISLFVILNRMFTCHIHSTRKNRIEFHWNDSTCLSSSTTTCILFGIVSIDTRMPHSSLLSTSLLQENSS